MSKLFTPLQIGNVTLQHRIIMAPLTRYRADDNHAPLPVVKEYYEQRASVPGTLLITEATFVSPRGSGFANVPGIWNGVQIAAWQEVTAAVHAKGSFIYCQLWALGRAAHIEQLESIGERLVSSSDLPLDGAPVPKALVEDEIWAFVNDFKTAAENAINAGFDGVEIHAGGGYLIDQFTQDNANKRTDKWGGSVENRSRFALEVAKAIVGGIGAERTAIRFGPYATFQGMRMEDPVPQFTYLATQLKNLKLAYLHIMLPRVQANFDVETDEDVDFMIQAWANTSPVLLAGGFNSALARKMVDEEYPDRDIGTAFGRPFLANPDLPFRIKHSIALNHYIRATFYTPKSEIGYIDYPFSKEFKNIKL
ncbi:putative inactive dehydrogenase easA [Lachnellula arida]|uniref:Putative inactive dehydrogenase easA n=1 Tax=Lachnellula arida TaxID=1316785 RepID=A0A8T9B6S6_9HELO|nr:putative inactive dehydrogenase easA [Lachnellula arida]